MIAFIECLDDDGQDAARKALESFAVTMTKERLTSPEGPEMIFFVSTNVSSAVAKQVRSLTKLDKKVSTPALVILDIPDSGGYYVSALGEGAGVDAGEVAAFIEGYKAKTLTRLQLA